MGKLVFGGILFMVGVFLCFTVIGAIPGTVMIFSGGAMMFAGVGSLGVSAVKTGATVGKIARERRAAKDAVTFVDEPEPEWKVAPVATSAADEIAKLADLLKAGHLTEDEFSRKKAQLLGL